MYQFNNKKRWTNIPKRSIVLGLSTAMLLSVASPVFAQNAKNISGVVKDENGEPIIGATVRVAGSKTTGTVTGVDGDFKLSVPASGTLEISYVGYLTKKVKINSSSTYKIDMQEDSQSLNDVVVVGYGTQKKATITGSVAAVTGEEIATTKSNNIQNMLTGKLPGVRNIQKTSEPGQFTNQFDIRGLGSPLIVVDGVPRGDMPRMDPNDIESISVLKDASAAIYGVRAANGVVLITTKKGENGKAKIEYTGYYGIQTPAEKIKILGARDRAILYNETTMRSLSNPVLTYNDDYFEKLASGEMYDTDWYSAMLKDTAPQQQHNISMSGGTDRVNYYLNFGYNDQGSFFRTNSANYHRYNLRSNIEAKITKDLKASVKLNMITDETNRQYMSTWEVFKMLYRSLPTDPIYANNTAPYYYHPDTEFNVAGVIDTDLSGFVKYKKNIFQSNMDFEYTVPFVKGLKVRGMFSYDKTYNDNTDYRKEYNEYRYNAVTESYDVASTRNSKTQLKRTYSTSYSTLWNAQVSYDNTFAEKHHVGAMVLYEESYSQGYDFSASRYFEIPIPYLFAGNTENQEGTGSGLSENASKAFVGRFNYDYEGKYIGEFSFRYDGSSKFPKGKQWGFFPSALLAYRISEESFIKDNAALSFINNLKLRGSWGRLGDDSASAFQFIEGYDYPQSNGNRINLPKGTVFGDTFVNALGFRNAPNMDLTWYTATMINLGIDADFWNGLFGFSVDFFKRDRDGLLSTPSVLVPGTFGAGISQANMNADQTKGFEIALRHHNRINQFQYNVNASIQMTRSMMTKAQMPDRSNSYDYWRNNYVNRYNDIWFGKGANGTFKSYEEIANSIYAGAATLPGDPIYEDWNGDGVIDDMDKHPIATTTSSSAGLPGTDLNSVRNYPLMNFSLSLGGKWKCIDFDMLFQGSAMSYVGFGGMLLTPLQWDGNAVDYLFDRWHPVDPKADPYDPSNQWVSGWYPYGKTRAEETSAFNIQNGAYLRLKSLEVGFTVPKNIVCNILGVQNIRLFVNAYNLFTITGVRGVDPEKSSETYGLLYPLNRTFNFGGTITF